jgi:hypothetical protein
MPDGSRTSIVRPAANPREHGVFPKPYGIVRQSACVMLCCVRHSVGTMGSYDCCRPFPATSGLPWRQVLHVEGLFASHGTPSFPSGPGSFWVGQNPYPARERSAALLGSREVLLKACPGLATPATPRQPRISGCLDAAFRYRNGVGIAMVNDFGAEPSRPASSLCTLPPFGRPTRGNTRYWSAC